MATSMRLEFDSARAGDAMLQRCFNGDRAAMAQSLSSLVEGEIIPRLVVTHGGAPTVDISVGTPSIDIDYEQLAAMALEVEADTLLSQVELLLSRGASVETVMVDGLAPAARLLGEYWESDRCDFVDVTMGLWRLQEVVHEIAGRGPVDPYHTGGKRALFVAFPGDQHHFGTVIVDEMFRRGGWSTDRMIDAATADLTRRVANEWFDLVGLTVSCDCHIGGLTSIIAAVRNVSRNPQLTVMVGGRIFSADPDLAERVGADGTAGDARRALSVAEQLVRERQRETLVIS